VREASEFALKEFIKNPCPENEIVRLRHFEFAFKKIKPSVSIKVNYILFIYIQLLICNLNLNKKRTVKNMKK
jgi:SpoVK/Ycf46/Vps4 family AAA+-type ATPase